MRRLLLPLACLLAAALLELTPAPAAAIPPRPPPPLPLPMGAGVDCGWNECTPDMASALAPSFVIDFLPGPGTDCISTNLPRLIGPGIHRVNMIWHWQGCGPAIALAYPGSTFITGNEPNQPGQDACGTPAQCAMIYRAAVAAIRAVDVSARFIGPGLADASVSWYQALETAGGTGADALAIHVYVTTPDAAYAIQKVQAFRSAMAARGDTRPLLVTEIGIAPGTSESVAPAALRAWAAAAPGLGVRAWAWFSVYAGGRWPGDLEYSDGTLTATGRAFVGGPARFWRRLAAR